MPAEGLITLASNFGPKETLDRLKAQLQSRGLDLFAEIDHAKNASEASLSLRPLVVVFFGNAKAGTPLMQAQQTVGIDLPLKALVWEDSAGKTWISYNDPLWIGQRHTLPPEALQIAEKMRSGLDALIRNTAEG
jgi:uncharacterized protein (DUF302 family)